MTWTKQSEIKSGIELIAEERNRQIEKEGWTKEHDIKEHDGGALALAAACYAAHPLKIYRMEEYAKSVRFDQIIPFDEYQIDNKKSEIKRLTIAGALIAAEIDRLISIGDGEKK